MPGVGCSEIVTPAGLALDVGGETGCRHERPAFLDWTGSRHGSPSALHGFQCRFRGAVFHVVLLQHDGDCCGYCLGSIALMHGGLQDLIPGFYVTPGFYAPLLLYSTVKPN